MQRITKKRYLELAAYWDKAAAQHAIESDWQRWKTYKSLADYCRKRAEKQS